jgi:uncharacterized protein YxjI
MHPALSQNLFLVKEHVAYFKAASNFDIYDIESGEVVLHCREDNLGTWTKMLRFTDYKRMTPFDIEIRTPSGEPVLHIRRGWSFFLSKVDVYNEAEQRIGGFQQKLFSVGGAFQVLDSQNQPLCELKGKWTSWEFSFRSGNAEIAKVSKKWGGLGKEMFTSADNYVLQIDPNLPSESSLRQLIMAAVMCIDMVLKE